MWQPSPSSYHGLLSNVVTLDLSPSPSCSSCSSSSSVSWIMNPFLRFVYVPLHSRKSLHLGKTGTRLWVRVLIYVSEAIYHISPFRLNSHSTEFGCPTSMVNASRDVSIVGWGLLLMRDFTVRLCFTSLS